MKEVVYREAPRAEFELPAWAASEFEATREAVVTRSTIVWGEHCTECAFPSCYSSCDFYSPRVDLHCRRFENGIEDVLVPSRPELTGLTRIAFRRWGKLEGSGPVELIPKDAAAQRERRTRRTDTTMSWLPLPRAVGPGLMHRMSLRRKATATRRNDLDQQAFFIAEAFLADAGSITFTLSMAPWNPSVKGLFQTSFSVSHGYNRLIVPVEALAAGFPLSEPFSIRIEVVGPVPDQPVVFGLVDFATFPPAGMPPPRTGFRGAESQTAASKTAKCVVWDLDNTMWQGTLVEDGIEGLVLNDAAVRAIRLLDERGILNSVASKNDEQLALQALAEFGLSDFLLYPQIGWGPKSDSVRRIADSIGIGVDTLVFIDDEPFERAEVSAALPSVSVMTPQDLQSLPELPLFDVPITAEAGQRRALYRNEEKRKIAASQASSNYTDFLRTSHIVLEISPVTPDSAERVYELSQRTNQLNISGSRFSREEVLRFARGESDREGYVLGCRDDYGSYGIVGFCVLNRTEALVEAFFLSCRVQRKCVENAFFAWLSDHRMPKSATELSVAFRRTEKNAASITMLAGLGFRLPEPSLEQGHLTRSLDVEWPEADIVGIEDRWLC